METTDRADQQSGGALDAGEGASTSPALESNSEENNNNNTVCYSAHDAPEDQHQGDLCAAVPEAQHKLNLPDAHLLHDTDMKDENTAAAAAATGAAARAADVVAPPPPPTKAGTIAAAVGRTAHADRSTTSLPTASHRSAGASPPSSETSHGTTPATDKGHKVTLQGVVASVSSLPPGVASSLPVAHVIAPRSTAGVHLTTPPLPRSTTLGKLQARLADVRAGAPLLPLYQPYLLTHAAPGAAAASSPSPSSAGEAARSVSDVKATASHGRNYPFIRQKLVLLGYQEVGKTSLRKCFESEPFFFKRLPDVKATTGVEVQSTRLSVDGEPVDLMLSDFAGQESYHSHPFFLTDRSIFAFVWKISAVEQDFQSRAISRREEERLYKWVAEVYAKFPRAPLVLIATHLDELRVQGQRSVEMILSKVERKARGFLDRVAVMDPQTRRPVLGTVVGNFAVSCKTRRIIAAGPLQRLSGGKVSALLGYLAGVAREACLQDRVYPMAAVPGRHVNFMAEVERLKRANPRKLLMPLEDLVHIAVAQQLESDEELLQVVTLMHSWGLLFCLHPRRLVDNPFIVLQPHWLSRMTAVLFSYAHVLQTPLHLRSLIGGLEYTVSHAEAADMYLMRRGYLRWPLARVLFARPLESLLQRPAADADVAMCLSLLEAMDLIYPVRVPCDDFQLLLEENPVEAEAGRPVLRGESVPRYYVPSLSPYNMPSTFKQIAPVLLHRGVRLRVAFNMLPDELWWRLQCRLHALVQAVAVHQPLSAMSDGAMEEELLEDFRLKEADDEHNRWKDALWLGGPSCRVLIYRDGPSQLALFSAEDTPHGAEAVVQTVEDTLDHLLEVYPGVQRTALIACPNPQCMDGWLDLQHVTSKVQVLCPACQQTFSSAEVTAPRDGDIRDAPHVSDAVLEAAGELLSSALTFRSCLYLCYYLGIPYRGPRPANAVPSTAPAERAEEPPSALAHVQYLHALDKVVQAALFRSWLARVEELARRRRMLEVEPSQAVF